MLRKQRGDLTEILKCAPWVTRSVNRVKGNLYISYKNGDFVCRKHANKPSTAVIFNSTVEKQHRDELRHQPSSLTSCREKRRESIIRSPPGISAREWSPSPLQGDVAARGPAGQGLQLTRGHRRGPRSYSPLPGLQTALQRCPASQRNKCLHYLLVNNFPFGFCF